jgi:hypothetical protein
VKSIVFNQPAGATRLIVLPFFPTGVAKLVAAPAESKNMMQQRLSGKAQKKDIPKTKEQSDMKNQ